MSKAILIFFICLVMAYITFNFSQYPYVSLGFLLFGAYNLVTKIFKQVK